VKFREAPVDIFPNRVRTLWGKVRHVDWGEVNKLRVSLGSGVMMYAGIAKMFVAFDEVKAAKLTKY
jgi:hypothetical protein